LFADDTLFFCGAQSEHLRSLQCIFLCFKAALGLRINLEKSQIVPIGKVEDVDNMAHILRCRVVSLPLKYLGLPLGASYKATNIWNRVIEKMERLLAGWKKLYFSKCGQLTLIKSTISNLPTYYMSLFPIPVSVAARLERLQLDFLWGWDWGLGKFLSTKLAQDLYFDKVKWAGSSKFDSA